MKVKSLLDFLSHFSEEDTVWLKHGNDDYELTELTSSKDKNEPVLG